MTLRLDSQNVLRCAEARRRGKGLECDTPIARPMGEKLVIRCRNCHADHVIGVVNGRLAWMQPAPSRVTVA
jgi:hypothetical protein